MRRSLSIGSLAGCVLVASSCLGEDSLGGGKQLDIIGGNEQTGTVGTVLPETLIVRYFSATQGLVSGAQARWTVRQGGGSINPLSGTTDASGQAKALWTLGPNPGFNQVTVNVDDFGTLSFVATGRVP